MVRMLRDVGLDAYHWDEFAANVYAIGFEGKPEEHYSLISAFEVWEHLQNPKESIDKIFKNLPDVHIMSTQLVSPKNAKKGPEWDYLFLTTGRHIFFYSKKALQYVAAKYDYQLYYYSSGIFIFSRKELYPFNKYLLRKVFNQPVYSTESRVSKVSRALFSMFTKKSLWVSDQKTLLEKETDPD